MFFLKELPTQEMLRRYASQYPEMDLGKMEIALHMLRRASLLIRKLEAYFADHDLSQTRFLILIVLDREPALKHLMISDLVKRLDVSKPVITNTLKTLAKDDLVTVTESKEDRRAKYIAITEQGRAKLQGILPGYYKLINQEMTNADD